MNVHEASDYSESSGDTFCFHRDVQPHFNPAVPNETREDKSGIRAQGKVSSHLYTHNVSFCKIAASAKEMRLI